MQISHHITAIPDVHGRFRQPGVAQDTQDMWSVGEASSGKRRYSGVRKESHEVWFKALVDAVPTSTQPVAFFTGGGPCSGKSAIKKHLVDHADDEVAVVDADEFKKLIPEYQTMVDAGDPTAAGYAHEESSYLAKKGVVRAIKGRKSFVYDSTFSNPGFLKGAIAKLRESGYRIVIGFADCPPEISVAREKTRAETTGRHVSADIVITSNATAVRTFRDLQSLADVVYVFSTHDDQADPFLQQVYSWEREVGASIYDATMLEELLTRGHSVPDSQ